MNLLFFLLFAFDGLVVGMFVFGLIHLIFGDNPFARLLKILLGIAAGIGYFVLCINVSYADTNSVSLGAFLFTILGPAGIALITMLIAYMFNKK